MNKNIFDIKFNEYDQWYEKNQELFLNEVQLLHYFSSSYNSFPSIEIGCGTGRFAEQLDIFYCGDIAKNALMLAKARNLNTIQCSYDAVPFPDNFFNFIVIIFSLSFFDNKMLAFKEIYRLLKKGKKFLILTINKNGTYFKKIQTKKHTFFSSAKPLHYTDIKKLMRENSLSSLYFLGVKLNNNNLEYTDIEYADFFLILGEKI